MAIYVLSANGEALMPCMRPGRIRRLLKANQAKIVKHEPFTVQLLYETTAYTQPMEIGVDSGYQHIGISVKSESKEFASAEYTMLKDEKEHHDTARRYRRTRRNRKRYRKPRWQNRKKPEGWIAPSLQHKAECHIRLIESICAVAPITTVTVEVGQFDPALLKAMQTGEPIPQGEEYQRGPLYFEKSLRAAVFQRDHYTCIVCGKNALKDKNVILRTHHALYWKGRHADTLQELVSVCKKCHTSANHQKGGKLYGLEPKVPRLEGATYMNIVRWYIVNTLKAELPACIAVNHSYGAETAETRKTLGITEKTHAIDAYCIGQLHPLRKTETEYFTKRRRNNRVLSKFYDAKYIDIRDGSKKSGAELGCGRTNRSEPRNGPGNQRVFRGKKISKGKFAIRTNRYPIQGGDIVLWNNAKVSCNGTHCGGKNVMVGTRSVSIKNIKLIRHIGGWKREKIKKEEEAAIPPTTKVVGLLAAV